ncbi:MAG: hypothetical protein QWI36_01930 [Wolbachia endosymbiont of Tyrophagus putrescentiae]|nr:hypothetical protein [Wolbachia endosymbiont of Tyrophagus putrescentiae]
MQEDDFICNSKNFMEDFLKAKKQESFKQCLEKYKKVDNFFNILKSNNILHRIAELKGKQKCGFLDELINHVNPEDLIKLINNKDERQKTPMRIAFENKVLKEKHRSSEISDNDNTYQFILKLIKYGADSNQLTLPNETLKNLPKDCYYYKLKEKLNGPIVEHKKSEKQKNETSITKSDIYLAKQEQNPDEIRNTLNDGNNILHQIVLLEGDQKCKR